jgi:hypothetical protein
MSHSTALLHRSIPRGMTVAIVATILSACASDLEVTSPTQPTQPTQPSERVFELSAVNGTELPYSIPNCSRRNVLTSASLILRSDHTYTFSMRYTQDGAYNVAGDGGSWEEAGSTIRFSGKSISAGQDSGNADGSLAATIAGALLNSRDATFSLVFNAPRGSRTPL